MHRTTAGLLAGLTATLPMTAAIWAIHRHLPWHERYPIPPRQITLRLAQRAGLKHKLDQPQRTVATYTSHFAYGAIVGALFALLTPRLPGTPLPKGALFGLAVWAGSYQGWLPAANILPPATRQPARRNAMMIAAHLVWGAVTGLLTAALADPPAPHPRRR